MFYHISQQKGLTELEPRASSHKQPWVYALKDSSIGLVFAGRDGFDIKADDKFTIYGLTQNGVPEIYELFSGCLNEILKGKDCWIYELKDSGFKEGLTGWQPEWVSSNKTKVVGRKYVPDILKEIKKLAKKGKFIIHYYQDTPEYNKMVESRIKTILGMDHSGWIDICCVKYYEKITRDYVATIINEDFRKSYENLTRKQLQKIFKELDADQFHGRYVRKELIYLYPKQVKAWVEKKYRQAKKAQTTVEVQAAQV